MDVSFRISFSCCSLFSCEVTTTYCGTEDDSNKTEVQPALDFDVYNINGADFMNQEANHNSSFLLILITQQMETLLGMKCD